MYVVYDEIYKVNPNNKPNRRLKVANFHLKTKRNQGNLPKILTTGEKYFEKLIVVKRVSLMELLMGA